MNNRQEKRNSTGVEGRGNWEERLGTLHTTVFSIPLAKTWRSQKANYSFKENNRFQLVTHPRSQIKELKNIHFAKSLLFHIKSFSASK